MTSPTYTIGHRYKGRVDVSHLDLYRFEGMSHAESGSLEEYFDDRDDRGAVERVGRLDASRDRRGRWVRVPARSHGRTTRRGSMRPASDRSPSIEAYAEAVASSLREGLARHGVSTDGVRLEAEPGRALFADAGIHLASVGNVKAQTQPIPQRWVETDTTEMFLPDGLIEHNRWTIVVAGRADAPVSQTADVVGMSCGFDVIAGAVELPDVIAGDVVAILDTGAYQDAASSNFNALPRPATVLVHGDEAEVVKRAETVDDVFRRDVVPDRLRESP